MLNRSSIVVFLVGVALSITPQLHAQRRPAETRPSAEAVSGVLKGALSTHDGATDWCAFVVGDKATYLITCRADDYATMKKLTGKRVIARGSVTTEVKEPSGETIKIGGTVGGIKYQGCVEVTAIKDVVLQPIEELTGKVEEIEIKSSTDPKKVERSIRFSVAGETPKVFGVSPAAAKKLKDHVGKSVSIRAYLNGDRIDEIEKATPITKDQK